MARALGRLSEDTTLLNITLSTGVRFISKPPNLHVPPWQMLSAVLGGTPLLVATWLTGPQQIQDTEAGRPECWDASLGDAGPVTNAEIGTWSGKSFGLTGGVSADRNHAKVGVSKPAKYAIFGDLNQAGSLVEPCDVPQNTRGGIFFVVEDETLSAELGSMMERGAPSKVARSAAERLAATVFNNEESGASTRITRFATKRLAIATVQKKIIRTESMKWSASLATADIAKNQPPKKFSAQAMVWKRGGTGVKRTMIVAYPIRWCPDWWWDFAFERSRHFPLYRCLCLACQCVEGGG